MVGQALPLRGTRCVHCAVQGTRLLSVGACPLQRHLSHLWSQPVSRCDDGGQPGCPSLSLPQRHSHPCATHVPPMCPCGLIFKLYLSVPCFFGRDSATHSASTCLHGKEVGMALRLSFVLGFEFGFNDLLIDYLRRSRRRSMETVLLCLCPWIRHLLQGLPKLNQPWSHVAQGEVGDGFKIELQ